jgi:hypothetical protein
VTPATYNGVTLTPPKLSGSFPATKAGHPNVNVILNASLLGFQLSNVVKQKLKVMR